MASLDRGTKRQCLHCSTKFYDLNRDPILCPSCGKEFVLEAARAAPVAAAKPAKPVEADVVEKDKAADEAGAEVISINDVEDDDDDDDDDESIPDVEDVEVDEELSSGQEDVFLDDEDDDDAVIGVPVTKDDDDT